MTKITVEDVRKVANLSRLNLQEEKIETYTQQLEQILSYVAQLQLIDTSDIPPTTRAVEVVNVTRDDISKKSDIREEILELGPQREGEFYRVPRILSN